MSDDKVVGGNGDGAAETLPPGPVVLAQFVVMPDGQMGFMMAPFIDDQIQFCLSAINLISGAANEHLQVTKKQASKILKAPPGMRVPRDLLGPKKS